MNFRNLTVTIVMLVAFIVAGCIERDVEKGYLVDKIDSGYGGLILKEHYRTIYYTDTNGVVHSPTYYDNEIKVIRIKAGEQPRLVYKRHYTNQGGYSDEIILYEPPPSP